MKHVVECNRVYGIVNQQTKIDKTAVRERVLTS
jgi:hypothetical protein